MGHQDVISKVVFVEIEAVLEVWKLYKKGFIVPFQLEPKELWSLDVLLEKPQDWDIGIGLKLVNVLVDPDLVKALELFKS